MAAKATQNLGCCDMLAGDIPAAFNLFNVAEEDLRLTAPGWLPVLATDKARALLAAGLTAERSPQRWKSPSPRSAGSGVDQELGQAELALAQAARPPASRPRAALGRPPRISVSAVRAMTPARTSRSSPGCAHSFGRRRRGHRGPIARRDRAGRGRGGRSRRPVAVLGLPKTPTWPSCSRPAR